MKQTKRQEPITKRIVTQYVNVKFDVNQICDDIISNDYHSAYHNFNKHHTFSSLGFCSTKEALKLYDKLDFHHIQEVFNFINKHWGWKLLNITPIIKTDYKEYSSWSSPRPHYGDTYTSKLIYTFYREIEEKNEQK